MLRYTKAEWIMLSEIFRGDEEKCFQIMRDFPEDPIFSIDPKLLYQEKRITAKQLDRLLNPDDTLIEAYEKDCWRKEISIITPNDPEYPTRLLQYYDPPIVLYAAGNTALLADENALTVVGTRSASEYGKKSAFLLSYAVAAKGVTIISGCAVGIDAQAHDGALSAGGKTIAVLGCGLDVNYPYENYHLRKKISQNGGLQISEYPPGTRPSSGFFPHRNRLMSALARAVLVVEAPHRSGSLITAEHAIEQGKELFCLPPQSIWESRFGGTAGYLRDGATPVFSAADILLHFFTMDPSLYGSDLLLRAVMEEHKPVPDAPLPKLKNEEEAVPQQRSKPVPEERPQPQKEQEVKEKLQLEDVRYAAVYAVLSETPRCVDELVLASGMPVYEVYEALCELELMGLVQNHSGNRYSKTAEDFKPKG